jgi:ferritin-like metal-binding protein YciE
VLGRNEDTRLLNQTLEEEKETDEKLTELADNINLQAQQGGTAEAGTRRVRSRRKPAA